MTMSLEQSFRGKKILITGATRGIGQAVAKRLHSYGAKVYALGRDQEALSTLQKECPGVVPIQCDLSNWAETEAKISALECLDGFLSNAGTGFVKTLLETPEKDFDEIFNTNVKGAWQISTIVAKKMAASGKGGSITYISSMCGGKPFPLFGSYCMTKAAIEMMAQCFAVQLGPQKVRVNVVRPASVDTALLKIAETGTDAVLGQEDAFRNFMIPRTPYPGYYMEMDSVVNTILFTMSDLTPQITGQTIAIDGGFQLT